MPGCPVRVGGPAERKGVRGRGEPWEVEPGAGPIGGEVRPCAETKTMEGSKKGEVVEPGETHGKGASKPSVPSGIYVGMVKTRRWRRTRWIRRSVHVQPVAGTGHKPICSVTARVPQTRRWRAHSPST